MTIFNMYIFDRSGVLVYYGEWNRRRQSGMTIDEVISLYFYTTSFLIYRFLFQEAKLMYGMLYSIKNFVSKMSPVDVTEGFQCYRTSKYMLNYLETPSGVKYVMNTDLNAISVRELLQLINSQVSQNNHYKHIVINTTI